LFANNFQRLIGEIGASSFFAAVFRA
jgi:hypothetical protein